MPIYEYQCKKCGHRFEKIHQNFSEARVKKCPQCGGAVEQLFSAPAAHFKGEGFYVTDYARKGSGKPESADGGSSAGAAKEKGSEGKAESKTETKSETKAETKTETKAETKSEKKQKK
ncbi:MAG: zinc ribbon domain-containing protein [Candidatus Koribacter versatilis]|uniref:Zinc ribbon domain-containing protein n=1 Tax=Candidatus Korobacter versatilis TaxID=658062 RepID=A0A932ENT0_9BACT|nr:zinc ribbon domain-containing protein [Candidatus Koribacter versatilis]